MDDATPPQEVKKREQRMIRRPKRFIEEDFEQESYGRNSQINGQAAVKGDARSVFSSSHNHKKPVRKSILYGMEEDATEARTTQTTQTQESLNFTMSEANESTAAIDSTSNDSTPAATTYSAASPILDVSLRRQVFTAAATTSTTTTTASTTTTFLSPTTTVTTSIIPTANARNYIVISDDDEDEDLPIRRKAKTSLARRINSNDDSEHTAATTIATTKALASNVATKDESVPISSTTTTTAAQSQEQQPRQQQQQQQQLREIALFDKDMTMKKQKESIWSDIRNSYSQAIETHCDRRRGEKRSSSYRSTRSHEIISKLRSSMSSNIICTKISARINCDCENRSDLHQTCALLHNCEEVTVELCKFPRCSCGSAKNSFCQHILFVLIIQFGVPDKSDLLFQRSFLSSELSVILSSGPYDALLSETNQKKIKGAAPLEKRKKLDDDPCGVCFEDMDDENQLVWCQAKQGCGKNLHKTCFDQWAKSERTSGRDVTCVFCRAPWIGIKKLTKREKMDSSIFGFDHSEFMNILNVYFTSITRARYDDDDEDDQEANNEEYYGRQHMWYDHPRDEDDDEDGYEDDDELEGYPEHFCPNWPHSHY